MVGGRPERRETCGSTYRLRTSFAFGYKGKLKGMLVWLGSHGKEVNRKLCRGTRFDSIAGAKAFWRSCGASRGRRGQNLSLTPSIQAFKSDRKAHSQGAEDMYLFLLF